MFVFGVLALTGCSWTGGDSEVDEETLSELRGAEGEPVYWAGRSVEGWPLVNADRVGHVVYLIYGDCEIENQGWFEDGGCAPPVDIQQYPLSKRHPAQFDIRACRRLTVRGVPAAVFQSSGGALEIYTGSRVIVIFGESRAQQRRIAEALRPLNGTGEPGAPLPPPVEDVSRGLADCRETPA